MPATIPADLLAEARRHLRIARFAAAARASRRGPMQRRYAQVRDEHTRKALAAMDAAEDAGARGVATAGVRS